MLNGIFNLIRFVTDEPSTGKDFLTKVPFMILIFPFSPIIAIVANCMGKYWHQKLNDKNKIFFDGKWKEIDALW